MDHTDHVATLNQLDSELKANAVAPASDTLGFLDNASQRLRAVPYAVARPLRIQCLIEIALQYRHSGQGHFKAVEPIALAVMLARQDGDRSQLRRALSVQGGILGGANNPTDALKSLIEALELAQELGDPVAKAAAWIQIGTVFVEQNLFADARECYERAAKCANEASGIPAATYMHAVALAGAALTSLQLMEFEVGLDSIRKATELLAEPKSAEQVTNRILAEATYTRLLVGLGRYDEASRRAAFARELAPRAQSLRADVAAACSVGLTEVYAGQVDLGLSRMTQALEKARAIPSQLPETLVSLVQGYERAGRADRAFSTHRELVLLIRRAQQNAILKSHELHLERLELPHTNIEGKLEERDEELRQRLFAAVRGPSPEQLLEQLALTVELREETNGEHAFRVGKLAGMLAKAYGLADSQCLEIERAARLHDVGKIVIPDSVIRKTKALNDGEWQIIRTHTETGADLIGRSGLSYAMVAEEIARYHHERWSGDGYPENLAGGAIPLTARMAALADVFDSLTHERPYRRAFGFEEALALIARESGKQFDPYLAGLFVPMVRQFFDDHADADKRLGVDARAAPFSEMRRRVEAELSKGSESTAIF